MNNEIEMHSDSNFDIWFPAVVEKAGTKDGETDYSNMHMKGIASTEDEDIDEEIMKADGLDVEYLLSRGFVNWHHQAKGQPATIIGEPEIAKMSDKGLFIKAKIYDTEVGRAAYELAKVLEKQSKTRRLGWSIEGKVIERDAFNKKIITKARLTGVALTHAPKNRNTFAELCKAMTDGSTTDKLLNDYVEKAPTITIEKEGQLFIVKGNNLTLNIESLEKAISCAEHGVGLLARESLEGGLKLQKPELVRQVLNKYPDISFEKALKIVDIIIKQKKEKFLE